MKEAEIVIYAKIGDMPGLEKANKKEHHLQLEVKLETGHNSRLRKVTTDESVDYLYTVKEKKCESNLQSSIEYTIRADEDFLKGFEKVASRSIDKTRYVFSSDNVELNITNDGKDIPVIIPNIEYEIDVYNKPTGGVSEWCKIDIEVDKIMDFISVHHPDIKDVKVNIKISHLPFKPTEAILIASANEEQKLFVNELWANDFSRSLT